MSKILKGIKGIDVSYAQGKVDWVKVKNTGIDFAVIRCGLGSKSETQIDKQYYNNAQGCIENNVPFGIYHFGYCLTAKDAEKEADFAIELANKYSKYVKFIAYDIEEDTLKYCEKNGVIHTKASLTACAKAFLEKVKAAGYKPVLYSNYDYIKNHYNYDELKDYYLWLAYPDAKEAGRDCGMWQYSWTGKVDGINCNVDMNFMYDDIISSTSTSSASADSQVNSSKKVDYSVTVTASDGVNLRSGAGTSYKIKSAVPNGTTLKITRQTSGNGYEWGYTSYNNESGWIALDYTKKVSTAEYHTVVTGDTLSWIAYKYNTTIDAICKLNKNIVDKDLIYVGQKIRVK